MELLGTVARLQVQQFSVKPGHFRSREYTPDGLLPVPQLVVDSGGAAAPEGPMDVHHRDHPTSGFHGDNAISILFTPHYREMQERFGDRASIGVAGENILIDTEQRIPIDDLRDGLTIVTQEGNQVTLQDIRVAEPCVEFTRYLLGYPPESRADDRFNAALQFLRNGTRGFYTLVGSSPATVRTGDPVYRTR